MLINSSVCGCSWIHEVQLGTDGTLVLLKDFFANYARYVWKKKSAGLQGIMGSSGKQKAYLIKKQM